jgi:uncharacterized protein with ATP-grasp and redox domains
MKTFLECIPCFMKQALKAGRIATNDERLIKNILDKVGDAIKDIPLENTPPETGGLIYKIVSDITGVKDPFQQIKQDNISHALTFYPEYHEKVAKIEDYQERLQYAIRIACAGNVIDLGVDREFDLKRDIEEAITTEFKIWDFPAFYSKLAQAKSILYIGDNSGEAVFDKILIEQLKVSVVFATRGIPVLNDITLVEAKQIGLDNYASLISSGVTTPGAILKLCNAQFTDIFAKADIVIAKGQGNYEALSTETRDIFFLMKAKCPVIAQDAKVDVEDFIFELKDSKLIIKK